MLYKFMKDGKLVKETEADNLVLAIQQCNLTLAAYDKVDMTEPETTDPPKGRKVRSDKGQSHKPAFDKPASSRKQPDYFVYTASKIISGGLSENAQLSKALTRDEALEAVKNSFQDNPRIIMGREVHPTLRII
jgi:hypothetical protein